MLNFKQFILLNVEKTHTTHLQCDNGLCQADDALLNIRVASVCVCKKCVWGVGAFAANAVSIDIGSICVINDSFFCSISVIKFKIMFNCCFT